MLDLGEEGTLFLGVKNVLVVFCRLCGGGCSPSSESTVRSIGVFPLLARRGDAPVLGVWEKNEEMVGCVACDAEGRLLDIQSRCGTRGGEKGDGLARLGSGDRLSTRHLWRPKRDRWVTE